MYLLNRFNIWFKGPGEYSPEKAMLLLEKALQFTFGLRTNINRSNDIPGKLTRFAYSISIFLLLLSHFLFCIAHFSHKISYINML